MATPTSELRAQNLPNPIPDSERKDLARYQRLAQELFDPGCYQGDIAREDIDELDDTARMALICIAETVATLTMTAKHPSELAEEFLRGEDARAQG